VVVAQCLGDDGCWDLQHELAQRGGPAGQGGDAEVTDELGEVAGVQRLAGSASGEQPAGTGVGGGLEVVALGCGLQQQRGKRLRHWGGGLAEPDGDLPVVGAGDVVDGQADDAGGWLGEQQHQAGGHAGAQRAVLVGEDLAEQLQPAVLGDRRGPADRERRQLEPGEVAGAHRPAQERPEASPLVVVVGGVPGVQVGLGGLGQGVAALLEPAEERLGPGELVAGELADAHGEGSGGGLGPQPWQLVPDGELAQQPDAGAVGIGEVGQAPVQPGLIVDQLLFDGGQPSREELAAVQVEFGLPSSLVHHLSTTAKRPALEVEGELLVAVVKTASWAAAEERVKLGEVQLVLADGFVISVDRDTAVLGRVRQDLQADPELASAGPAAVLPSVANHAVDGYGQVLSAINNAVEGIEDAVFTPGGPRPTERIYNLSRQVLELRRAMAPLTEMLDRLAGESPRPTGARLKRRFREQRAHLQHLVEGADGLGNLLSNVLQAYLTEVSVRQNDDMRRISAWVAIWAVPTLLAGVYGMNFRHMPELDWRFAYPTVLLVMVAICLVLYRGFRRSGWL
jgi:magnesium transporter